jgi:predicted PurR-regulated permease PerM
MNSKIIANGIIRALLIIVGIITILFFLWKIEAILIYIALASVISLIGRRFVIFFNSKLKLPNTIAVIVTMSLFIGIMALMISLFVPLIIEQSHNLSRINIDQLKDEIQLLFSEIDQYFSAKGVSLFERIDNLDLTSYIKLASVSTIFSKAVSIIGSITIGIFATLFISFFMLKDGELLDNMIFTLVPSHIEGKARKSWISIKDLLSKYFSGLATQVTILFILYTILFSIFGIKNAIIIALLCALLNLIPYVGPFIEMLLILTIALTSNLGANFQTEVLPTTIKVLIGFGLIQLFDAFINQPMIYSKSVKSHPLEIFLAILIGGTLFGVIGMVVAVPTYTALRVILKEFLSENKIVQSLTKNL